MKKVLVILGSTATGKTDLALSLAKKIDGELVSADSRQVYKGLDVGTGKMPGNGHPELVSGSVKEMPKQVRHDVKIEKGYWEINGIKIWMYDVVSAKVRYTVADYVSQADKIIEDILKRDRLPIIVGGTGLYIKALIEGLSNLAIPVDEKLRGELEKLSLTELQEKLRLLSPTKFESLNSSERSNKRRLLRSIELIYMNPYIRTEKQMVGLGKKYKILKIGLTAPREVLNKRIDLRLISRISQGLIKEGERLYKEGLSLERMKELGLEYGVLAKLLGGEISENQFIEQLSAKIHQYAKRQMTWFKKEKDVTWFDVSKPSLLAKVENVVASWYYQPNDKAN